MNRLFEMAWDTLKLSVWRKVQVE